MKRAKNANPVSLFAFQDIVTGLCGVLLLFVLIMLCDILSSCGPAKNSLGGEGAPERTEERVSRQREDLSILRRRIKELQAKSSGAAKAGLVDSKRIEFARSKRELEEARRDLALLKFEVERARDADAKGRAEVIEMERTRRLLEERLGSLKKSKGVTLIPERGQVKAPFYLVLGRGGIEWVQPIKNTTARAWFFFSEMDGGLSKALDAIDPALYTAVLLVRPSGADELKAVSRLLERRGISYGRDPLEDDVDIWLGKPNGEDEL